MFASNSHKARKPLLFHASYFVNAPKKLGQTAFTLVEVMIAAVLMGVVLTSVFSGILYANTEIQLSRENMRATQVILEKMEGIRLYTFDQLVSSNMFPTTFVAQYSPLITTNQSTGVTYYGKLTISDPATSTDYNPNLRLITVSVTWTNQLRKTSVARTRQMQTLVARYGIQNYSFFN